MNYELFNPIVNGRKRQIFLVDMKEDKNVSLFSTIAQKALDKYIPAGKKVLIIGGKKGLASGVQCQDCGYIPKCNHCDIPVAYHRDNAGVVFGICHICKTSYSKVSQCPSCQGSQIDYFGTGMQKIQELVLSQYPQVKITCIAAEQVSSLTKVGHIEAALEDTQCVIATSLLQMPARNRHPDVVIVVRADSSLSIPDRKVSEHCYTMLKNCIQNYNCPVIVQAFTVGHHALQAACKQDNEFFRKEENQFRQQYAYPPFSEMAVVLYKHEIEETMFTRVHKLYQELLFVQKKTGFKGEIFATPPLIYKMYDKYRYNIVLKGDNLRKFLEDTFVSLDMRNRGFKIDRLPENVI